MANPRQVRDLRMEYEDFLLRSISGVTGVGGSDRLKVYVSDERTKNLLEKLFKKEIDGIKVEIMVSKRAIAL